MRPRDCLLLVLALATAGALLAPASLAWAGGSEPAETGGASGARAIGLEADRVLRAMGEYLQAAQEFTFEADVTYDSGAMIQYGGVVKVAVRRPDRLRVEFDGDERRSQIIFDRGTFTFHDRIDGIWAATEVPPGLDAAIDTIFDSYGFSVPIADLVYADPYQAYEVVAPPVGASVPYVPEEAGEVTVAGKKYFVYDGTFYRPYASEDDTVYVMVEDPRAA